jgi:very-short-patch-repair endonuclease
MKQVVKKRGNTQAVKNKVVRKPYQTRKVVSTKHHLPGTSKLEEKFATEFLEKLGVKYIYQFEAKDIGRWFDFYLPEHNIIIEVDGSYYHADPRVVSEDKLKPMHKKNIRVDEYKNRWALAHGIPILRIWEKDINEKPGEVLKELKARLYMQDKKATLTEKKNKRHINKIK